MAGGLHGSPPVPLAAPGGIDEAAYSYAMTQTLRLLKRLPGLR